MGLVHSHDKVHDDNEKKHWSLYGKKELRMKGVQHRILATSDTNLTTI